MSDPSATIPAKRTGIAAAVSIVGALIFSVMCDQFFQFLFHTILPHNDYVIVPFVFLRKFGPAPIGVILSAVLERWAFPTANTKTVYRALAVLLVIVGIIDVIYGGGGVMAFVEVPVVLITIAMANSILQRGTAKPDSPVR